MVEVSKVGRSVKKVWETRHWQTPEKAVTGRPYAEICTALFKGDRERPYGSGQRDSRHEDDNEPTRK